MSDPIKVGTIVRIITLTETDKTPGGRAGKHFGVFALPMEYPTSPWPREKAVGDVKDTSIRVKVGVDDDGMSSAPRIEFRNPS